MLTAVRNWVIRTMMKSKGETGIVQTMPKRDLVELNTQITAQRLMQGGIDPNSLKNADQVENAIIAIESRPKVQQGIKSTGKIFDMEGKEINPRSKIMGGKQSETDAEIKARLDKSNKEGLAKIRSRQKMLDDAINDASPGFSGDRKVDAELVAENLAERMGKVYDDLPTKERLKIYDEAFQGLSKRRQMQRESLEDFVDDAGGVDSDDPRGIDDFIPDDDPEPLAKGGRAGFKDGMTRRTFLKLFTGLVSLPIVGKFLKPMKVGKTVTKVPMIKTDDVAGKPEWFDALVNKVIRMGEDVTDRFATKDRETVNQINIGDGETVRVYRDIDEGAVRVEYESPDNVYGDQVVLEYKKPLPDEGDPRPTAEFNTAESGPVGRVVGPDDVELDVDEVGGTSIEDLDSDVSKLKEFATGQKPTMKEIVQNKKRKDKAARITDNIDGAASDAIVRRQGDYDPSDYED